MFFQDTVARGRHAAAPNLAQVVSPLRRGRVLPPGCHRLRRRQTAGPHGLPHVPAGLHGGGRRGQDARVPQDRLRVVLGIRRDAGVCGRLAAAGVRQQGDHQFGAEVGSADEQLSALSGRGGIRLRCVIKLKDRWLRV